MNDHAPIDAQTAAPVSLSSIAAALACAQLKMGKALKSATNPHFRSKYADLGSVVDACVPALNEAGIAVIQPTTDDDGGRYVETILIHGESGETLKCRVPLIVQKNDMQGYGSAVTYARRYGLMAMAGIAPEDDDGNAAAKAPPSKDEKRPNIPATISAEQFQAIKAKADEASVDYQKIADMAKVKNLFELPIDSFDSAMKKLQKTIDANAEKQRASDSVDSDEIPY